MKKREKRFYTIAVTVICLVAVTVCYHYLKPSFARMCYKKGASFVKNGEYKKALKWYKKATKFDPTYMCAWTGRGYVLKQLERYEELLEVFDDIIKLNTGCNFLAWRQKGAILYNLGRYEEAVAAFDSSMKLNRPLRPELEKRKGLALEKLGRHEEALQSYEKSIEMNPDNMQTWYFKAEVLKKLNRQKEAESALKKAKELGYK